MQEGNAICPTGAGGADGVLDLGIIGDAGRHDQRLAHAGGLGDQRRVDQLERGDLVGGHVEGRQKVHGGGIKG